MSTKLTERVLLILKTPSPAFQASSPRGGRKNTLSCLSGILSQGEVGKILPPRSFYVIKENIGCICVSAIYRIANCKDL